MAQGNAKRLYGSTDEASGVPDCGHNPSSDAYQAFQSGEDPALDATSGFPSRQIGESQTLRDERGLAGLEGAFLADALEVWECYDDRPLEGAPLLLRFEDLDLLVSPLPGKRLSLRTGVLDASAKTLVVGGVYGSRTESEAACPAWVPASRLAGVVGRQVVGAQRTASEGLVIHFEGKRLRLASENGSVVAAVESPAP